MMVVQADGENPTRVHERVADRDQRRQLPPVRPERRGGAAPAAPSARRHEAADRAQGELTAPPAAPASLQAGAHHLLRDAGLASAARRSCLARPGVMSATPPSLLDPADWDAFKELAHRVLDDAIDHLRTRARAAGLAAGARCRARRAAGAAAGRGRRRRGDRRGRARHDPPLPHRQHPSALLRLGARLRHCRRPARRDHRRGDERQSRRPRPRRDPRRAPGDRLVPRAVRLSRGCQRAAGQRHLDGDADRARGRAQPSAPAATCAPRAWPRCRAGWSATPRARRTAASPARSSCSASAATRCAGSRSAPTTGSTSPSSSARSPPTGGSASGRSA